MGSNKGIARRVGTLGLAGCLLGAAGAMTSASAQEAPPLEVFATYPMMTNVGLSPDGESIALMRLPARDGNYIIEVFDVDNLDRRPVRLGADKMEIQQISWVSPNKIWAAMRQQVRDSIEGVNQGVYEDRAAIFDKDPDVRPMTLADDASIVAVLRDRPNKIMIRTAGGSRRDNEGRAITDLATRDFYEYDLERERQTLVLKDNLRFGGYVLDMDGEPRAAFENDRSNDRFIWHGRPKGEGNTWTPFLSWTYDDYASYGSQGISILGFDPENANQAFVLAHRGRDTRGVYLVDVTSGDFVEAIYHRPDVDIDGAIRTQHVEKNNTIAGFSYYLNGKREIAWLDPQWQAYQASVDAAFPNTRNTILDCYNDCATMLVFTQAAKDPGSYYLIKDGRAQYIGGQYPLLEEEQLGEERFITYEARDGRAIPAIVTMPAFGEAPHPLVIVPHGGPWIDETRAYNEWAQVLASHGYMVLQPQYRGSLGYGIDHWISSWGQWGYTMQDDKDDGANYLVEQGLADPDRLAMFGWSYGGYAAFAAAVREPQLYRCAIAGAGVSDINRIQANFTQNPIQRQLIREGYRGLDVSDNVEKTNIPILVIHGEVDMRVPIYHSNVFVEGLRRANKPHRYVVLEDADHFSNTINFDNQMILFSELLNWLSGPCGMPTAANRPGQFQLTATPESQM